MSASGSNGFTRARLIARGAVALGVGLLCACAVGPNFRTPPAPTDQGYTPAPLPESTAVADQRSQRFVSGGAVPADWWKLFGAPDLDQTVSDALAHNETLAAATASLRASEDNRRAGYGLFLPQVAVGGSAARERVSPLQLGQTGNGTVFNLFTLTGSVGYTLDIFGGERRRLEALGAEVDRARDNELAAYLALTANVVNTTIARAAYRAEIAATQAVIAAATDQAQLTEVRYQAGTVPYASVLALKSQLASLQASLPPLELRSDQAGHLLAVLAGRSPATWSPPEIALNALHLPEDLPVSLPSALVRQRPDVLAAEANLHAASAAIGIATADMLPSITLSGDVGSLATRLGNLGKSAGRIWSGDGGISIPVFRGGSLWFARKAAVDAYQASAANYRQTVLTAFQQVADTLRALGHDADTLQAAADATAAAQDSLKLTRANYDSGLTDYLALMIATEQYENAHMTYLQAEAQRLQDTVALYVALGGGWWSAAAPGRRAAPSAPHD